MAWVPLADSSLADVLEFFSDLATLEGSTVVCAGLQFPEWGFNTYNNAVQMRITANTYSTSEGAATPAYFYWTEDSELQEQHNEGDQSIEFLPSPFEVNSTADGTQIMYNPSSAEGPTEESFEFLIEVWEGASPADNVNCDCDCGYPTKTRAQMRAEVAIAMGYSAQLAALPPSFIAQVNFNLNFHQRMAASDIVEINAVRYFTWDVAIGQTKFCTTDNLETCRNVLAATRIKEVYVVHDGNVITRLRNGIPFQFHEGGDPPSTPSRYEVRSCIEIWPAPTRTMKLVAKGSLAAIDMATDSDTPTVDPDLIILRCIAFMKANKGHADAGIYMGQYTEYLGNLNFEQHNDRSYIPGCSDDRRDRTERLTHRMEPRIYGDEP